MITPPDRLAPATVVWRDGVLRSVHFEDIYQSPADGLGETRHVFIAGNRLPERWQALRAGASFVIGETGFGSGLNLLVAGSLWLASAPENAVLHYVSVEKHPLARDDFARALAQWPAFAALAAELARDYPPPVAGCHRLVLAGGRIQLTLLLGDATTMLNLLRAPDHPALHGAAPKIDAWFLDGFAPARNPDMWSPALFAQLAALSRAGTSFATFTAAGDVRRGLAEAGFAVTKVAGHGSKRDMLCGTFAAPSSASVPAVTPRHRASTRASRPRRCASAPWYLGAAEYGTAPGTAAIVGAGIAGCTSARALAERGWQVTLYDRTAIASGASGNPQGVLYPRLTAEPSTLGAINLAALLFARNHYRDFWQDGFGTNCGVLLLPETAAHAAQLRRIAARHPAEIARLVEAPQLAAIAGLPLVANSGLLLPGLGWVNPAAICRHLVAHPRIAVRCAEIVALTWDGTRDGTRGWQLVDAGGATSGPHDVVVLANAAELARFEQTRHLPLKTIHGQISVCPATPASANLRTVICGAGYLAPATNGLHTFGATYDLSATHVEVRSEGHRENLAKLDATDPRLTDILGTPDPAQLSGRAALRCVTPDYLPLVGPAPIEHRMLETFAPLRRDARADIPRPGSYWPGLFIHGGHGSRGLSHAPLCAALLADLIEGRPRPLAQELAIALHPARFLIRDLKRGRR
ncbi:MAG: bifunctional tRNA (5-methylaminomethyl-2-thiouridine)(34)-methyltransferase MnmD/FAD-dependent 5-carboxymethylaminomethyl-2-thiouridine(34) oxidoreductase MnmC [Porticoccaceae bacterium]